MEFAYTTLHDRIRRTKIKPKTCQLCNKKSKLDLSNISGEYKYDHSDWIYLCRSCHRKEDHKKKMSTWSVLVKRRIRNRKWKEDNKERIKIYYANYRINVLKQQPRMIAQ